MKAGFVSLVGRPNVGKSTLLNAILNTKIAITSDKAGTTRTLIQGIYHDEQSQIVFVDTPGIQKPMHKLGTVLNKKAYTMVQDVDLILFLIDAKAGFGKGDQFILKRLENAQQPVFLLLNKIDQIPKEKLLELIMQVKDYYPFQEIIPVSALTHDNVTHLIDCIKQYLPMHEPYYSDEEITNLSVRFLIGEMVREKVLQLTHDEVPHSVTCMVETFEEQDSIVNIQVLIVVDRDSLKKIIIGKNGQMLKKIGSMARRDMEAFLKKKVYLSTYVKTISNWRDREKYLLELGLKDSDEDV